jgi:hypothetical protein
VPVDRWQICRFTPPSHVMIEVGVAHAGKGGYDAAPEHKASSIVVDFITPETETSHWYFWGMARNFKPQDKELTATIREGQGKIFSEDREMLERSSRTCCAIPSKLLMLNIDAGGVQSRRFSINGWRRSRHHEHRLADRPRRARDNQAEGICSYELVSVDGTPLPAFTAGAHRRARCPGLVRQYSLCNPPHERHRYVIGVLRDPARAAARKPCTSRSTPAPAHHQRTAQSLPAGGCAAQLLAGGIGITPLLDGGNAVGARRAVRAALLYPLAGAHRLPRPHS